MHPTQNNVIVQICLRWGLLSVLGHMYTKFGTRTELRPIHVATHLHREKGMAHEKVIIVGYGGLGREVLWAARRAQVQTPGWTAEIIGFTGKVAPDGDGTVDGLPYLGGDGPELLQGRGGPSPTHYICAIGNNTVRKRVSESMDTMGLKAFSLIDPAALIFPDVVIGAGSFIAAQSIISASARIGRHVVVNFNCSVGHDVIMGDFAHICPGVRLSGGVWLEEGAFIGTNGVVNPKGSIGQWSTLGSSSMTSVAIQAHATAVGVPARVVWINKPEGEANPINLSKDS